MAAKKAKKTLGKKELKKTKGGLLPAVMPVSDTKIPMNPTLGQKWEFHF